LYLKVFSSIQSSELCVIHYGKAGENPHHSKRDPLCGHEIQKLEHFRKSYSHAPLTISFRILLCQDNTVHTYF